MSTNDNMPTNDTIPSLGIAFLGVCCVMICSKNGANVRDALEPWLLISCSLTFLFFLFPVPPFARRVCKAQSSFTWPILYISITVTLWAFVTALVAGDLNALNTSHLAFLGAGAAAAISIPHFLIPAVCSHCDTEQGSDVPAPRPPPPGRVQPSEQVPGEDSTVPAQGRHLEQDDRSWSLDLESAFASEEEQRLL